MDKPKRFQEMILNNIDLHIQQVNDELILHRKDTNSLIRELKDMRKCCFVVNEQTIKRERADKKLLSRITIGLLLTLLAFALGEKYKLFGFTGLG